jgi:hypothetical protein
VPKGETIALGIQERFQTEIEKVFFKGKSNKKSIYLTFVIGNVVLMLLLFYLLLNNFAYAWTGQLYPAGSGFRLQTGLDTAIPFVPEMVVFYVYLFYPLVILTMLYFGFIEYNKGYALGWSLVTINAIAVLVYIVFPVSTFRYRQELLAQPIVGNIWEIKFTEYSLATPPLIVSPVCMQLCRQSAFSRGFNMQK